MFPSQISKSKILKKNHFRFTPTGVNLLAFHRANSSNCQIFNFFPFFTCLLLQGLLHILFFFIMQKIQKCPQIRNWIFTFFTVLPLLTSIAPKVSLANTGRVKGCPHLIFLIYFFVYYNMVMFFERPQVITNTKIEMLGFRKINPRVGVRKYKVFENYGWGRVYFSHTRFF